MPHSAIVTDTDGSLPADLAARYAIRQVPIMIQFGGETFATGVDMDDARLFARIDREGKLPTTSAPSPGQFAEAYEAAFSAGAEAIVCLCVSSKVSATYSAAMTARDLLGARDSFRARDIRVVDTRGLAMNQGFMALAAAEAAQAGASADECVARALDLGQRTHLYAALATLKYLAMSGRVGHLAAGMATLLNIKPILTLRDGKLDMLERIRTSSKAEARLIELATQAAGGRAVERMAVLHVNCLPEARRLAQKLCARLACPPDIIEAELTPGLSVHTGTGMIGVTLVTAKS